MKNEEMFNTFCRYDFERVREFLDKGYTETSEWKERLEALYSSLDALLKDMDNQEVKYA